MPDLIFLLCLALAAAAAGWAGYAMGYHTAREDYAPMLRAALAQLDDATEVMAAANEKLRQSTEISRASTTRPGATAGRY